MSDTRLDKKIGYPSIDRPWLKYYTKEQIDADLPECKVYDYILENNKDDLSRAAINYYGRKLTYRQLFRGIEDAAKAFLQIGVKEGDIIAVISVTIPETIYTFYGLNRIGAVSNMIDPRTSAEGIREYILEVDAKVVVVLDMAYEKIKEAIVGTNVSHVIMLSPSDSLPAAKKLLYRLGKGTKAGKTADYLSWRSFVADGADQVVRDVPYKKDTCCVIVHTGGTTGRPKGVMLSNDNLNCSAFQLMNSAFTMKRGDIWADVMPPFIAYGIGNGLHMPLVKGMEVVLIPAFDPEKYDKLMIKYRPTQIVGVPSHYEGIINSRRLKNKDMSYLESPVVGGDTMKIDLEDKVNSFLKEHNVRFNILKGYGMTEVSAAVSACMSDEINKRGSVGIPFAHTVISAFDHDTGEELKQGQKGEICITGPNTMLGYYDNEEETDNILKMHDDGRIWVHSGDLGHIDEDGMLFIEGRIKRMIIRHDGFKVFPGFIENTILKNPLVKQCCVVGQNDLSHAQGMLPIAYIVLRNDKGNQDELLKELKLLCEEELPEYAQPRAFFIIDSMPLTSIGKIDYRYLEKCANTTS